jgi:hypothetical protein
MSYQNLRRMESLTDDAFQLSAQLPPGFLIGFGPEHLLDDRFPGMDAYSAQAGRIDSPALTRETSKQKPELAQGLAVLAHDLPFGNAPFKGDLLEGFSHVNAATDEIMQLWI